MAKWNGIKCEAESVLVVIEPGGGEFMWWQPYVGKTLKALIIHTGDQVFCLYDGDGSATRKVNSGGGPNMPHKNISEFRMADANDDPETLFVRCDEHKWSKDKKKMFKAESRYCTVCMIPEILENLRMR